MRPRIAHPTRALAIGETVSGRITTAVHPHALMIPVQALVPDGDALKVFVVDPTASRTHSPCRSGGGRRHWRRSRMESERPDGRHGGRVRGGGQRQGRLPQMKLFDVLHAQRRFIYLLVAVLSIAGLWSATRLPSAIYPELTFPRITIVAQGSSLGARQVVFVSRGRSKRRSAWCQA